MAGLLALGAASDFWAAHGHRAHRSDPVPAHELRADERAPGVDSDPAQVPADSNGPASDPAPRVDLNRATARELDALPGIGPVLAKRIVDYRSRYGSFREVDDLRAVQGIGPRLLAKLRSRIDVRPPERRPRPSPP